MDKHTLTAAYCWIWVGDVYQNIGAKFLALLKINWWRFILGKKL